MEELVHEVDWSVIVKQKFLAVRKDRAGGQKVFLLENMIDMTVDVERRYHS